mmetsp:Transcript_50954/g.119072  ORF Transcript_50954/g.119072 Transcript_50954/m.119072 type:complete len:247 (+) Transcript_50954:247-987(+)
MQQCRHHAAQSHRWSCTQSRICSTAAGMYCEGTLNNHCAPSCSMCSQTPALTALTGAVSVDSLRSSCEPRRSPLNALIVWLLPTTFMEVREDRGDEVGDIDAVHSSCHEYVEVSCGKPTLALMLLRLASAKLSSRDLRTGGGAASMFKLGASSATLLRASTLPVGACAGWLLAATGSPNSFAPARSLSPSLRFKLGEFLVIGSNVIRWLLPHVLPAVAQGSVGGHVEAAASSRLLNGFGKVARVAA